jgi:PhoPQ-activated pathogenicity-related protein
LQAAYQAAGVAELFQPNSGKLTGLTPFSYAASAMDVARQEYVSTNVLVGDFGPEVGLLTEASERENATIIAAAADPAAQAILFAAAAEPLVGEELFAASAYAGNDSHRNSLQAQDVMRWLLILGLLAAAALKMANIL